ncbi:unnamed protein product [Thelazia callipaeda]|uniref:DUF4457 domain-containing protein n=1 Tax=Thelazia callipaeda TaxID=103827 RepID=A0A0N5D5K5_THECL|nr:unnamed protein product [Thelazia callipaeda]
MAKMGMKMNISESNGSEEASDFSIPELPEGQVLRFVLYTSWDDPHFIGINTIELFNVFGEQPEINQMKTNAKITQGSLDNVFKSRDADLSTNDPGKMWSARYDDLFEPVYIEICLEKKESIAMIRIWNYNKSRVHALCGVHDLRIDLDSRMIFQGEISCAFTFDSKEEPMVDTILFTTDETILELIAENDKCLRTHEMMRSALDLHQLADELSGFLIIKARASYVQMESSLPVSRTSITSTDAIRPSTGDRKSQYHSLTCLADCDRDQQTIDRDGSNNESSSSSTINSFKRTNQEETISENDSIRDDAAFLSIKVFHMELLENWGAPDCIGLTGLQFFGPQGTICSHLNCNITTSTAAHISRRLLNGKNLTRSREDMWLTPFSRYSPPVRVTITFPEPIIASGICVWNYNASPEMSYAGVRSMQLYVNGKTLPGPILLRKAPDVAGFIYFDYVQDIIFNKCILYRPVSRPENDCILAFTYQLQLHSTWGDEYYIGLNGIEFYDHHEELIKLLPQSLLSFYQELTINLAAFPESVNILPNVSNDQRTSDKLIDGYNDTENPSHMWLTPILPNRCARVFVIFDAPTYVSRINVYNYRKTSWRGVRLISISIDDLIVYSGEVPQSTPEKTGLLTVSLREE